jgi:hypothetical protein
MRVSIVGKRQIKQMKRIQNLLGKRKEKMKNLVGMRQILKELHKPLK